MCLSGFTSPSLYSPFNQDSVPEVQLDALDIMQEMLKKFGTHMIADHAQIQKVLLTLLGSNRSIVRKRAIACIGMFLGAVVWFAVSYSWL